jgi:hypothetical protein
MRRGFRGKELEIVEHSQFGEAEVRAIEIGDDVHYEEQRQDSPGNLAASAAGHVVEFVGSGVEVRHRVRQPNTDAAKGHEKSVTAIFSALCRGSR